jgi:hypothetical protein
MVAEWNATLEYSEYLSGIGWFTFDIWPDRDRLVIRTLFDSSAPMSRGRRFTIRDLSELNRCGWCSEGGCEALIRLETGKTTLNEGEEEYLRFIINPGWLEAKIQLGSLSVTPITTNASIKIGDCLIWKNGTMEGCVRDHAPWYPMDLDESGSLSATIPIKVHGIENPENLTVSLIVEVKMGRRTVPCPDVILVKHKKIRLLVIPEPFYLYTSLIIILIPLLKIDSSPPQ